MKKIFLPLLLLLFSGFCYAENDLTLSEQSSIKKLEYNHVIEKPRTTSEWREPIRTIDAVSLTIKANSALTDYFLKNSVSKDQLAASIAALEQNRLEQDALIKKECFEYTDKKSGENVLLMIIFGVIAVVFHPYI